MSLEQLNLLKTRALFFKKVRDFFEKKDVLEVDVPILNSFAPIDRHIEVMEVKDAGFLHTSPEYGIKILLSTIKHDVFQMSHVFRKEEKGSLHNPEFTMVEWYRLSSNYFSFIEEVLDFCELFLGAQKRSHITYHEAFLKYADIDVSSATPQDYEKVLIKKGISFSPSVDKKDLVLTSLIEPHLGSNELTVFFDYPKQEAALAKTYDNGTMEVAKRFEIYFKGIELANGYDELSDGIILKDRLEKESLSYLKNFDKKLEVDKRLIMAMEDFPECCGVAVGFDRLLMLNLGLNSIQDVLPSKGSPQLSKK